MPKKERGRGLIDIPTLCNKQINNLKEYFYNKENSSLFHSSIIKVDFHRTLLELCNARFKKIKPKEKHIQTWIQKILHGRQPNETH